MSQEDEEKYDFDDDYVKNNSSDEEEMEKAELKLDSESDGELDEGDEQRVVEIIPLKKGRSTSALMAKREEEKEYKATKYTTMSSEKALLVLNERTITASIDLLLTYLHRVNDSIKQNVAQELESNIVEQTKTGGINTFINELAKYLTVIGYAKEVHFDKLIGELNQPQVNVRNIIQSVTDNFNQFSDQLLSQKKSEIQKTFNSVLNPTARVKTAPFNVMRLQPIQERVLYVPSSILPAEETTVMEVIAEEELEEDNASSSDFLFFMDILDQYQRQGTKKDLDKLKPMKKHKSTSKEPRSKFGKIQDDVNAMFRIRRDSEQRRLDEQRKIDEKDKQSKIKEEEKRLADLAKEKEPKKKPGRPPGKANEKLKKVGGKEFSPEVITTCTFCNVNVGSVQLKSIQQYSNNEFSEIKFCSFTCLNNHNFRSKQKSEK